jgi:hypothetical protein
MKLRFVYLWLLAIAALVIFFCASPNDPFDKPYKIDYTQTDKVFTVGTAIPADTPDVGGELPISFRITPSLPRGVAFDTSTAVFSGTPVDTMSRTQYTVSAFNNHGSYSVSVYITVNPAAPLTLVYDLDTAVYKIGVPIFENSPSYTGGAPSKYESDRQLPEGLRLDATKGTIYGTPIKLTARSGYTITGSNASGSASAMVVITVDTINVIDTTVAKPQNLKVVRIDTQKVKLWWNKVIGANSYLVNRSLVSKIAGFQVIKTVSDTFCFDTVRGNGYYFVNARRGAYASPSSDTAATLDTINQTPVNRPPMIISSLASRSIKVNETDTVLITATDADTNQTLLMKLTNLDSLRKLFGADSLSAIQWKPGSDTSRIVFSPTTRAGTYKFAVRVYDGIDSVFGTITVYVGNVNRTPEWTADTIRVSINDGASWTFTLADSCHDPDSGAMLRFQFVSDSLRSTISDGRFIFSAGSLDTVMVRSIALGASDGKITSMVIIKITIIPVYYTLTTSAQNGTITLVPDKTSFRMGESARLTGVPSAGYEFVRWTGDVDSTTNPITIIMDKDKAVTANFRRYETDCTVLTPGVSINAKIQELSGLPDGSTICPDAGKYDNGTIGVEGKVTVQVNEGVLY